MKFVIEEVVGPLSRRMGSAIGGALLALGATNDLALQVEVVSAALIAFACDLVLSKRFRK